MICTGDAFGLTFAFRVSARGIDVSFVNLFNACHFVF